MKKKYLIPFFVLIFTFLFPVTAYAGGINEAEQGIISAISATYEYNGAYYKVTDAYIAQVTAYLSQDGVDLTSDQASEYLSQFYANIATGISSGYMVQVGEAGGSTPEETKTPDTSESTDETETETESPETEEKDSKEEKDKKNSSESADEDLQKSEQNTDVEETESEKIEIVDNTIGSTQSGKIDYTVTKMDAVMYVWDIDSLDVHAEAYKDSDVIGTLYPGDKVIVTGAATTGWAQIDYNGETGYVSATYLRTEGYMKNIGVVVGTEESEELTTEENTTEESLTEEAGKDYSNAAPISKSVKIEVIAVGVVAVLLIICAVIVLLHKNKSKK